VKEERGSKVGKRGTAERFDAPCGKERVEEVVVVAPARGV